jgi:uncharacterized delta-60 repeat protein
MFLEGWKRSGRAEAPKSRRKQPTRTKLQIESLEKRELLTVGFLDTTFGPNGTGLVTTGLNYAGGSTSLAVQANGDFVIAGVSKGTTTQFSTVRFLPNGTQDMSFNNNTGFATAQFAAGSTDIAESAAIENLPMVDALGNPVLDKFGNPVIQQDIVVAGSTTAGGSGPSFGIARFLPNGTLDPHFGNNGKVIINFYDQPASFSGMAIEPDGRIVVVGTVTLPNPDKFTNGTLNNGIDFPTINEFALARCNTDGTQDSDFDADGKIVFDFSSTISSGLVRGVDDGINAVTIQPNGDIVVAGFTGINNKLNGLNLDPDTGVLKDNFAVARFNENNGFLDAGFGTNGCQVTDFVFAGSGALGNFDTRATSVSILHNNDIAAGGITAFGSGGSPLGGNFGLAVYTPAGVLDRSYNGIGILSTNFATDFTGGSLGQPGEDSFVKGMLVEPNGELVMAGNTDRDRTFNGNTIVDHTTFALDRLNANGTLDQGFGVHGQQVTQFTPTSNDGIANVALLPNGDILGVGTSNGELAFAAYTGFQPGSFELANQVQGSVPPVFVATSSYNVNKSPAGTVTITVERVNGTDGTVTVDFSTQDGSTGTVPAGDGNAKAGVDYVATHGALTFTPGVAIQTFTISILDNGVFSTINNAFTVAINNPGGGAALGTPDTASVVITNNDSKATNPNNPGGGGGGGRQGTNLEFLQKAYVDVLGRKIDASGQAFFLGLLAGGTSRQQVVLDIEASQEYRTDVIQKLYQQYLHRAVDPAGLGLFLGELNRGATDEQIAATLIGSGEYFQNRAGGTNAGFLNAIYADILGRAIDQSGLNTFSAQLAMGVSRVQIAHDLFSSNEYLTNVVDGFYAGFLQRQADAGGLNAFVAALQKASVSLQPIFTSNPNGLNGGFTDELAIAIIVGSTEFFTRVPTAPAGP